MTEEMVQQKKITALFFQELEKQTLHATHAILAFEKGDQQALLQLKLAIHSIKGAAKIVTAEAVERFCHCLEDLIQAMEQHKIEDITSAIELLIRGIDLLVVFSHSDPSCINAELQSAISHLQHQINACISHDIYELAPTKIDEFSLHFHIRDAYLSIETKQARQLLGMAYEVCKQAEDLQHVEEDKRRLAIKNHAVSCAYLCNMMQSLQMIPFSTVAERLERFLRELLTVDKKDVRLVILNERQLIDKEVLDKIKLALLQLIKNAVDHGIETPEKRTALGKRAQGMIVIDIQQHENRLFLSVTDDGAGINYELLQKKAEHHENREVSNFELLFTERISTKNNPSLISGRGIGLKSVKRSAEEIGGIIDVETLKDVGTSIELNLPTTLSLLSVVLFDIGGELYGCMSAQIEKVESVQEADFFHKNGHFYVRRGGDAIRVVDTRSVLGYGSKTNVYGMRQICFVKNEVETVALEVDQVKGTEEVMMQSAWPLLKKRTYIMGCALSRTTNPVLLLRMEDLLDL